MAVESKTVNNKPKQKYVTSAIAWFKNSMHYLHVGMMHYYLLLFQFLFCDHALDAPEIP